MSHQSRRQVLKKSASLLTFLSGCALVLTVPAKKVWAALKLVDPKTNAIAKALQYVHNGKNAKARTDKLGVKAADQRCDNCQLYKKAGEIGGKEVGNCSMIAGVQVAAAGWCVSWVKAANYNPAAKKPAAKKAPAPKKK